MIDQCSDVLDVLIRHLTSFRTQLEMVRRQNYVFTSQERLNLGFYLNMIGYIHQHRFLSRFDKDIGMEIEWFSDMQFENYEIQFNYQITEDLKRIENARKYLEMSVGSDDVFYARQCLIKAEHEVFDIGRDNTYTLAVRFIGDGDIIEVDECDVVCKLNGVVSKEVNVSELEMASEYIDRDGVCLMPFNMDQLSKLMDRRLRYCLLKVGESEFRRNHVFRRGVEKRTASGVSLVMTTLGSYLKIQDREGRDFIIITQEDKVLRDNLKI